MFRTKQWLSDDKFSHCMRFYPREMAFLKLPHGVPPGRAFSFASSSTPVLDSKHVANMELPAC